MRANYLSTAPLVRTNVKYFEGVKIMGLCLCWMHFLVAYLISPASFGICVLCQVVTPDILRRGFELAKIEG